jgi:predicted RecB family nuclease
MRITTEILDAYLACKTKGHLKLAGAAGTQSDYEAMTTAAGRASREVALATLIARFHEDETCRGLPATAATLQKGTSFLADAVLESQGLSLRFDGLERRDGPSQLGDHHYLPILHRQGKVGRSAKLLLAALGLALGWVQGLRPNIGLVACGTEGRLRKVQLHVKLYRQAEQVLDELKRLLSGSDAPRLALNLHCRLCEFTQKCHEEAEQADDISLLEGMGEKELRRLNRKGMFTLTQLSCTFRARRKPKRVKRTGYKHYAALRALAIRERKVHVYGTPEIPRKPVQVFFDAEGNEDGSFAYLLGVLIVERDSRKMHSLWADSPDQKVEVFDALLDLLDGYEDFCLYHYGNYENKLLRRMRKVVTGKRRVDRLLGKTVNVLSAIHASVYFPTLSNGLKDIGRYLGCTWTDEKASGLQSLVWRARWEQAREPIWKQKLLTYNAEDCAGLKKITEYIQAIAQAAQSRREGTQGNQETAAVAWAEEITAPSSRSQWRTVNFALADFDHVNRCAYFDYQRQKVFLRTSAAVKKACMMVRRNHNKRRKLTANREIEFVARTCPTCKGKRITKLCREIRSKVAYDLKLTTGAIRRNVIRCKTTQYKCEECQFRFLPKRYRRRDKHLHGLKSWAMYQYVFHRISLSHIEKMFDDQFGLRVHDKELYLIRSLMARRYRKTVTRSLDRIVSGSLAHVDETHINLRKQKGYVWVLANLEDVVYLYRPNRETGFLQEMFHDFKGVFVTDFYTGYDSLPCEQQKCLIHLIRDFNGDLESSPYDEEFKALAADFGKLLKSIVETIDKHGLVQNRLHQHKAGVASFFRSLEPRIYRSQLAESYQKRLLKNEGKLFTFLAHDGVPWNNNPAEHAVKQFAFHRNLYDCKMNEDGLSDYLVLLSVYVTCKYRGVSFLKFLLSQEEDVEDYCRRRRKRHGPAVLEVYPEGFPPHWKRKKDQERNNQVALNLPRLGDNTKQLCP